MNLNRIFIGAPFTNCAVATEFRRSKVSGSRRIDRIMVCPLLDENPWLRFKCIPEDLATSLSVDAAEGSADSEAKLTLG
jgi:hypothetical protein